jgi:dTDP-4-amino-4,6-dideoxygalactose transaminase
MIKLASPDIRNEDIAKLISVIESGNLVQGEQVKIFEQELCKFSKIENCAVVSSGTAALHLSLLATGIKAGDSVIVSAFTFPATANVVEIFGANTILCDVEPHSYVCAPDKIEETILKNKGKKIHAIMLVHEFGYPASAKEISEIAKKYKIKLIEDSACALGTIANRHHTGFYSDVACFSFHPRKAITTGDGGAILSQNEEIAEKIKLFRNHGMHYLPSGIDFPVAGLNYRMTDFQAAMAIGQIQRFKEELDKRKNLAKRYIQNLKDCKYFKIPEYHDGHSWQSFMIVLDKKINRKNIIENLLNEGIQSNLGAQALNCLSYFQNKYHYKPEDCPNAKELYENGLVMPLYGKLSSDEIDFISAKLKEHVTAWD